jgi:ACS family pantothenate transporter-like MFS transporter
MAGGWIQAGLLQTLAGKGGLPAWKWIFIIVSVMTVPVALFGTFIGDTHAQRKIQLTSHSGWVFIPDLPAHRAAWYLNAEQKEHAVARLGSPRKESWDRTVFKRVLLSWQFWLLPFIFMRTSPTSTRS